MSFCPGHHDSQWLCHSRQRHSNLNSSNREPNSETARRSARNCFVTCRDAIDGLAHALLVPQRKIERVFDCHQIDCINVYNITMLYKCPNRSSKFMRIKLLSFLLTSPFWGNKNILTMVPWSLRPHMATGLCQSSAPTKGLELDATGPGKTHEPILQKWRNSSNGTWWTCEKMRKGGLKRALCLASGNLLSALEGLA